MKIRRWEVGKGKAKLMAERLFELRGECETKEWMIYEVNSLLFYPNSLSVILLLTL